MHVCIWESESKEVKGSIVGFHGLTSHGSQCFHYLAPFMAKQGWSTFALDFPGLGHWTPEKNKAEKNHWGMGVEAVSSFLNFCREKSPTGKLILIAVSITVIPVIEYILNSNESDILPDYAIFAVPALKTTFPKYMYPLIFPLVLFTPNLKLGLKRFIPKIKSNDTNSIIYKKDPYTLNEISLGYVLEAFKSMQKLRIKRKINPMEKWPSKIPIMILTAGQDVIVDSEYASFFCHMLPSDVIHKYMHYKQAHHYLFYEDNREEIFEDILQFISESI